MTLLRAIRGVGLDNQFVNLDTANLILYGKGNPHDPLEVLGTLVVRRIHAKDRLFPTGPKSLGKKAPIGQGKADLPRPTRPLKQLGYKMAITIERETSGPKQTEDIRQSKFILERLVS